MTDPVLERGCLVATTRTGTITTRLVAVLAHDVPRDVAVTQTNNDILLSGRNLAARYASDPRLNGIAMTARAVLS
jgi:hypothetical protein